MHAISKLVIDDRETNNNWSESIHCGNLNEDWLDLEVYLEERKECSC